MTEEDLSEKTTEIREREDGQGYGGDYPLQDADKDPRWAVRTVKVWLGIALFSLFGILVLMILGIFYE